MTNQTSERCLTQTKSLLEALNLNIHRYYIIRVFWIKSTILCYTQPINIKRPISKQPIPKNAQRVFKGKIFDVYQWEQKLFDGTSTTFEGIKRMDTVNVIPVTPDHKIVLAEQQQPGISNFIGVLGGRIDEGETPLDAAKRELLEEAGMEAQKYVLWEAEQLLDKIDWAIYTFIAKGSKKISEQSFEAGEKIKLLYVTFDEFIDLVTKENCRDMEIALKIFRVSKNPPKLEKLRKLFTG